MKIYVGGYLVELDEFIDSLEELIEMEVIRIHIENDGYHIHSIIEERIIN